MWDDDDFDPTAQINERVADAVAVVGIIDEAKDPEADKPEKTAKPKQAKTTTSTAKSHKELSRAEIEEMQKRNETEMFASVLGMEVEKDNSDQQAEQNGEEEKQFEELEKELREKELAAKQQEKAAQKPKHQKKKMNKAVYDDYVEDEFDEYDRKFDY